MDEVNTENKNTCPADRPPTKKELEEKKARERKGTFFIVGFVVFILLAVAAALFLPDLLENSEPKAEEYYNYNGFEFTKVDGTWYTHGYRENTEFRITLRRGPKELENIQVTGNPMQFRSANDFYYITFDPREEHHDEYVTMSMAEITANLRMHFGKNFTAACTVNHSACTSTNTSVVTCQNTDKPVIHLKREPGAEVRIEDNCAVIKGQGKELVSAADRFLYGMYGIMK